ncbi:DUF4062 domain-containing protein [Tumebacillus lipolyticus]|uniref:DUF4062 domain-containing protein n=1 Tax=Tumebacillus lipolyticus TaxID=1280370 RepID=A0ABW4ZVM8_9BACL
MLRNTPHIFIGGTYSNLIEFRQVAYDSMRRRATIETMEDFPTADTTILEACYQRLEKCDHYLLIIGDRYGSIPNGHEFSITELEYEKAKTLGLKSKVYIYLPEQQGTTDSFDEDGVKLRSFIEKVRSEVLSRNFHNAEYLRFLLEMTTEDWFEADGGVTPFSLPIVSGSIIQTPITISNHNQITVNIGQFHAESNNAEELFEGRLKEMLHRRHLGDRTSAAEKLRGYLKERERDIPQNIRAKYNLQVAIWVLEDGHDIEVAANYAAQAKLLDPTIDDRIYQSLVLSKQAQFDEALQMLEPLNKEEVLTNALVLLRKFKRAGEADQLIQRCNCEISPEVRNQLALCFLAAGQFDRALRESMRLMRTDQKYPRYFLTAGYIEYWRGFPEQYQQHRGNLFPLVAYQQLFIPTAEQILHLNNALEFFAQAQIYADTLEIPELIENAKLAWILTAVLLPKRRSSVEKLTLDFLRDNPTRQEMFRFALSHGFDLDPSDHLQPVQKMIDQGTAESGLLGPFIEWKFQRGEIQQAADMLEDHKADFYKNGGQEEWIRLTVLTIASQGNWSSAYQVVENAGELDHLQKGLIRLILLTKQGRLDEAVMQAQELVDLRGLPADYENLTSLLVHFQEWERLIPLLEQKLQRYPDAGVVEKLADALLKADKLQDCLATLRRYENLYPEGELSHYSKRLEVNALWGLSQNREALQSANLLWEIAPTIGLLMTRVQLYQSLGDQLGAQTALLSGLERGFDNAQVYVLLSDFLKHTQPEQAFRYAKKAVEKYPEKEHLYLHAMQIGHATNHDDEASEFLLEIRRRFPDSQNMRLVDFDDLMEINKQWQEQEQELQDMLSKGKIPLHIVTDAQKSNLGGWFYQTWRKNCHHQGKRRPIIPLAFGAKYGKGLSEYQGDQIKMDYTACLTSHALQLFDLLKQAFSVIYVSPDLIPSVLDEINRLNHHQPSVEMTRNKVLTELNRLPVKLTELLEPIGHQLGDTFLHEESLWKTAEHYKAWLVKDSFATEWLGKGTVPKELQNLQVYPHEVLHALIQKGELSIDSFVEMDHEQHPVRTEIVDQLVKGSNPLLVDMLFLQEMAEHDWLEQLTDHFDVLVPTRVKQALEDEQEHTNIQRETIQWLEGLVEKLRNLLAEEKLHYLRSSKRESEDERLTGQMRDILEEHEGEILPIWCDERCLNSYVAGSSSQAPLVNVFDVLSFLENRGFLTGPQHVEKLNKLYRSHVQYRVPPAFYVQRLLMQSRVDHPTGNLIENRNLLTLRYSLDSAIGGCSFLGSECLPHYLIPERVGYIKLLQDEALEVLRLLWKDYDADTDFVETYARSEWVLRVMFEVNADLPDTVGMDFSVERLIAQNDVQLVLRSLRFSEKNRQAYLDWLYPRLLYRWNSHPQLRCRFIEEYVNLSSIIFEQPSQILRTVLLRFTSNLPEELAGDLLKQFGFSPRRTLHVENLTIPHEKWELMVNRSLERGHDVTGEEHHAGHTLAVTFHEGQNLATQFIQLHTPSFESKIPVLYEELTHPNPTMRLRWLMKASPYLYLTDDHLDRVRSQLGLEGDVSKVVEELQFRLSVSHQFYFLQVLQELLDGHEVYFPSKPEMFRNWLPIPDDEWTSDTWYGMYRSMSESRGARDMLSVCSAMPMGGDSQFSRLVQRMVSEQVLPEHLVRKWCRETLSSSRNPIQLQNILRYLVLDLQDEEKEVFQEVMEKMLNVESGDFRSDKIWFDMYLAMLKYADCHLATVHEYQLSSETHRSLWAYLYADRMVHLFAQDIHPSLEEVEKLSQKLREINKQVLVQHPILMGIKAYPLDVAHPRSASMWRTVVGGALGVLEENPIKHERLLAVLRDMRTKFFEQRLSLPGIEEVFLTFARVNNPLSSPYARNNMSRLQDILQMWGVDQEEVWFDPNQIAKQVLMVTGENGEMSDLVPTLLRILSRSRIDDELVPAVLHGLERYRISLHRTDDTFLVKGVIIADAIAALPEEDRAVWQTILVEDLADVVKESEEKWKWIIMILAQLSQTESTEKSSAMFLDFLKQLLVRIPYLWESDLTKHVLLQLPYSMPLRFMGKIQGMIKELP